MPLTPFPSQKDVKKFRVDSDSPYSIYIVPLTDTEQPGVDTGRMVVARVSQEVGVSLGANYGDLVSVDNTGQIGKLVNFMAGRSFVTQALSKQVWTGAAQQEITFDIFFIAENDPVREVRDQIVGLYRLVTPTEEISVPNVKSDPKTTGSLKQTVSDFGQKIVTAGAEIASKLLKSPPRVSVVIPNILNIPSAYITNVDFKQSMRLMRSSPQADALPLKATGSITVKPEYMILQEQLDTIFPKAGGQTKRLVSDIALGRFPTSRGRGNS